MAKKEEIVHPLYLEDDHIKDSIVRISYNSNFNLQYLGQKIIARIEELYIDEPFYEVPVQQFDNTVSKTTVFYTNDKYSYQIQEKEILFNCVGKYAGWSSYVLFIENVLSAIDCDATTFSQATLRYISLFEEISIFDKLNGKVVLKSFPQFEGMELNFRFGIAGNQQASIYNALATVRTRNWLPSVNGNRHASIVDIELSSSIVPNMTLDILKKNLEYIHEHEKHVFFSLISQEYINELKPHYPDDK